jgi:uncharacterized protein
VIWATVIVMAKSPRAGKVKTRLCPPLTPDAAARVARASLLDTLAAAGQVCGARTLLALDGPGGSWLPPGLRVVPQAGEGLGDRLAAAFAAAGGPALAVGMDTPQLTPRILGGALEAMRTAEADAVLGPARDGGYWAIGLMEPDERVFRGVPMSDPMTGAAQRERLLELGLRVRRLPALRDVDEIADALAVAAEAPETRFASALSNAMLPAATGAA